MVVGIALAARALRLGLQLRRGRLGRGPRGAELRRAHLRVAKPAVVLLLVGFVGGPVSAFLIRDWTPFQTFHAWVGLLAAGLFASAAWLGNRMQRGHSRAFDVHALLGGAGVLAAAVAAVAGFSLLP